MGSHRDFASPKLEERTGTKCYIQWRSFGYESLGGGTFSPDMEMWTYDRRIPMAGGRKILAGGVAFPLLLLLLPIALIGGAVDLIKKIVRLVKRDQR